ncbi:cache domain-containing protein [Duganella sp. S19_KUP01_CR8]|uniref:cache domain-containing protein n=1 Tax=Duganella sp. S19_KUP01_CR8 TaxID=3025502 RepID=UPI002FCD8933
MTHFAKRIATFILATIISIGASAAPDKSTPEQAQAMVKKAVAYMKSHDREAALTEFSNPKGSFIDRDLYIFVIDLQGKMVAHGALPKIINKQVLEMKDPDDKYLFKDMLAVANGAGSGWVNYKWPNPSSKAIEPKTTFVEKVGDLVIGCGVYK